MATKKQKREAAEAKRAKFEEEHRQSGLRALKAEQERRRQTEAAYKEQALQVKQTLARGLLNNGHTLSEVDELLGESIAVDVVHLDVNSAHPVDTIKIRDFHQALSVGGFFEEPR